MADRMCKADGCDKPIGKGGGRGMCQKHLKRWRETYLALGLELPPRETKYEYKGKPSGKQGKGRKRVWTTGPQCLVEGCEDREGEYGGEGRCRRHLADYVDECREAGRFPLPISNRVRKERTEPGYEVEDWPEFQHAGLSVDGKCSAPWGCPNDVGPKDGRGLCGKHWQRWRKAYLSRGWELPLRPRDPQCRMPADDELVALIREHGSYTRVAAAAGVNRSSLEDFLRIRPGLKARMEAEWRPVSRPGYATEEERHAARTRQYRDRDRRRRLVSEVRLAFGVATEQDAVDAFEYANLLDADPCSYCGGPCEQIDHIAPVAKFGGVTYENLTASCGPCNGGKSDRSLLEYLLDTRDVREQRMTEHGTLMPAWPKDRSRTGALVVA